MTEFSLLERINKIFDIILSSSFFVALLIIIVLTIILLVLNKKSQSLFPKIIAALGYSLIAIYIITRYGSYFFSLNDSFVDRVFSAMYFPNLITYLCMLFISIFLLITNLLNKKQSIIIKIGNIICFSLISFLFVLVLDVVKSNKIDVYDVKSIYSNETLMILLQASMYIFFIWIGILFINYVVNKITTTFELKSDSNNKKHIISLSKEEKLDEIKEFTDDEFKSSFIDMKKENRNEQYKDIIKNKDIGL